MYEIKETFEAVLSYQSAPPNNSTIEDANQDGELS